MNWSLFTGSSLLLAALLVSFCSSGCDGKKVACGRKTFTYTKKKVIPGAGIVIYYRLTAGNRKVKTYIRGRSTGYIAFGWGFSEMVPSYSVVAYRSGAKTMFSFYKLRAQNSPGVQPVGSAKTGCRDGKYIGAIFNVAVSSRFVGEVLGRGKMIVSTWAKGPKPSSPTTLRKHTKKGTVMFTL